MTSNPMNTTTQNTTHRRVTGTRRLTALSAVGLMALTGVAAAPATAAPDASEAPASISQPAAAQYIAVNQFATGLDTAAVDCGPAGAVSAMLAESHTPRGWDAANPAQAVAEVRKDVGHAGATVEADMARALQAQGVTVDTSTDFTGALDQAREGKTAMMNGYMTALPYQYASGNPPVVHWIVVTNHDPATNTFTVLDSNDGSKRDGITQAQLEGFQASLSPAGQHQVVVG